MKKIALLMKKIALLMECRDLLTKNSVLLMECSNFRYGALLIGITDRNVEGKQLPIGSVEGLCVCICICVYTCNYKYIHTYI